MNIGVKCKAFFFHYTIFAAPLVRITVCLALSALVYATNLFYLKNRNA